MTHVVPAGRDEEHCGHAGCSLAWGNLEAGKECRIMLVDRTEAIEIERQDAERTPRSEVARLVLGGAPGVGEFARSGEELAGRITRLASMAAVLHAAQAAALQRAPEGDRGGRVPADRREVSR